MAKTKRKLTAEDDGGESDSSQEGSDVDMIDITFDFFDPQAIDYHSINRLLTQLFSHDQSLLNIPGLTELILKQATVGSTVKTDGNESDPFSLLTVLNLNHHRDDPAITALIAYLLPKLSSNSAFHETLSTLLTNTTAENNVGLVISERLVNMPSQLVPPMYRMLEEELQWARNDKEPFFFSHLLFLSRVFVTSQEEMDQDPNATLNPDAPQAQEKKQKKKKLKTASGATENKVVGDAGVWLYHPEDEFIARSASHSHQFTYTSAPPPQSEQEEAFGVETRAQAMLVPWEKFGGVVTGMEGFLGGGAT